METYSTTINNLNSPISVKEYLHRIGISATLVKRVKYGGILVDGKPVTVRETLHNGMTFQINLPNETSDGIEPIDIPLNIIYEDDYILAIDKPTGMPTHPSRGNHLPTLANAVMGKYNGNFVFRAVNRLDRDTSGIVIVAKDALTAYKLSESMKRGEFKKRYLCTVIGTPENNHGIIDAPIRRENPDSIKRIVADDGKRAITEYTVKSSDGELCTCDILLHTGRTHQIRVHMACIGHPLHGDFLYGERTEEGYFLRCYEISLPHPFNEENLILRV